MKWLGLTGGIACGKSTISQKLRDLGYAVIDADIVAREVVRAGTHGLKSVVAEFGEDLLKEDGSLDRRKLGQKVFGHPERLRRLESLLHPLIRRETQRLRQNLEESGVPLVIYDVPLLFETKGEQDFDAIIVISCTKDQQKSRLKQRSHLSDDEIEMRLASQIPLAYKEKNADYILRNDRDQAHLESEINKLHLWLEDFKNHT